MMRMTLTNLIVERPAMVFFVRVIVAFCTGARTRKCTDRLFHQCDRHVDHVEHLGGNGPEQKAVDPTQAPRAHDDVVDTCRWQGDGLAIESGRRGLGPLLNLTEREPFGLHKVASNINWFYSHVYEQSKRWLG